MDSTTTITTAFVVEVRSIGNTPPTITAIADQTLGEGGTTGPLAFTVGDMEMAATDLIVTAQSNNPGLIPNANLVLAGGGANRIVTVTPLANTNGTATITLRVFDGAATATTSFVVMVKPINDAPAISTIADQTIDEDSATGPLAFKVSDAETAATGLTVTAQSDHPELIPDANLVLAGSGADRTVTVNPLTNANGSATITLSVTDGTDTTTTSFAILVNPVNDAPIRTSGSVADLSVERFSGYTSLGLGELAYSPGPANESDQTLTYTITQVPDSSFGWIYLADGVTQVNAGSSYTLEELQGMQFLISESAFLPETRFSFGVKADGGTARGGVDTLFESLKITVINSPPAAVDDAINTLPDFSVAIPVLANDTDIDGDSLTVLELGPATNGTVSLEAGSTVKYAPNPRFIGSDRFTYTISDSHGGTAAAIVEITVGSIMRVSVATDGTAGDSASFNSTLSGDGNYVAMVSRARLVPEDTNDVEDIFVHDLQSAQTTRVSVATDSTDADQDSFLPAFSPYGKSVAFTSMASTLVPDDTNGVEDIFIHDRHTATTIRVSVALDGTDSNDKSYSPVFGGDATWVAFDSHASNLIVDDTNTHSDIFMRDRTTDETTRVSIATDGTEADADSFFPAISNDGRYVVFNSRAANLVPDDTNNAEDVFIHDRQTRKTRRVSVASDGTEGDTSSVQPAISIDGRYVSFDSDASNLVLGDGNDTGDIFQAINPLFSAAFNDELTIPAGSGSTTIPVLLNDRDFQSDPLTIIAVTQPENGNVVINPDNTLTYTPQSGFSGTESFTYTVDDGHGETAMATVTVTVLPVPNHPPVLGDDITNTVPDSVVVIPVLANDWDPDGNPLSVTGITQPLNGTASLNPGNNTVTYRPNPGIVGTLHDPFTYTVSDGEDTATATVEVIVGPIMRSSVSGDGYPTENGWKGNWASLSANRCFVAFDSEASDLVPGDNGFWDVFVHDRQTGEITRISVTPDKSQANNVSWKPAISADGNLVAFESWASNLVPNDTNGQSDIFVYNRGTQTIERVSVATAGDQSNGWSESSSISADDRYVAFESYALNLVPGDTNNTKDIFVHDRQTGETTRVSLASDATQSNNWSYSPTISADGCFVAFQSDASNLVPEDTNGVTDIFVHDCGTGQTTRVSVASDKTQSNSWSNLPSISGDGKHEWQ